jgi:hypothetical protein
MRTRILPMVIAAAAVAVLAGCSATGSAQSEGVVAGEVQGGPAIGAPAPAPEAVGQDKAAVGGAVATAVSSDRQIVKNAYVSMRVDSVSTAVFDIHGLIKKRNGLVSNEDTQAAGESTSSMITAQIPAPDLDAFISDVTRLGTVDTVTISAQDVTGQVVDLDARIKALQTSVDRMTQLLAQAQKIDDMLAIETQLASRQAELDSLTAQRKALGDQVALSSVTIALSPTSTVSTVDAPGFLPGLESGWAALVSVFTVMVTAAGFLLPFGIIALAIIIPIVVVVVRQSRRRRRPAVQPRLDDAATAAPDERAPSYPTT